MTSPVRPVEHFFQHARDVREVVGYRKLTILARHPAGDDLLGASLVEPIKILNRNENPVVTSRNGHKPRQLVIRRFAVAVKSHENRRRSLRPHKETPMHLRRHRRFND
jgi:hypothetical protein